MSGAIRELAALIRAHRQRLVAVHRSLESALQNEIVRLGKTPVSALIVAGLLENYDWDRLDFLVAKLFQAHPLVLRDLERFDRFMSALQDS